MIFENYSSHITIINSKYKASRTESYNYIFAFQHTELGTFIANSLDTGSGGFVFAILELEEIDSRFKGD